MTLNSHQEVYVVQSFIIGTSVLLGWCILGIMYAYEEIRDDLSNPSYAFIGMWGHIFCWMFLGFCHGVNALYDMVRFLYPFPHDLLEDAGMENILWRLWFLYSMASSFLWFLGILMAKNYFRYEYLIAAASTLFFWRLGIWVRRKRYKS